MAGKIKYNLKIPGWMVVSSYGIVEYQNVKFLGSSLISFISIEVSACLLGDFKKKYLHLGVHIRRQNRRFIN